MIKTLQHSETRSRSPRLSSASLDLTNGISQPRCAFSASLPSPFNTTSIRFRRFSFGDFVGISPDGTFIDSPEAELEGESISDLCTATEIPQDAKGKHPEGKGIVVMEIDQQTGWVKLAKMETSTGNKLLDDAALQSFSHWRFWPGTVRKVHSPITFTMASRGGAHHRMAGAVISH